MKRMSIVLLLVALAAGACGGDDAPEASTSLSVTMTEFAFEPDAVAVPAGQEVTIELINAGSVEHDFVVLKRGQRIEAEADLPDDAATLAAEYIEFEQPVQPGERTTVTFTAPESGSYQIICTIPGHFTAGMEGRLRSVSG